MTMQIEPNESEWDEIAKYKMPRPQLGDLVVWYNNGDTSSEPKWGFVAKVEDRTIIIRKQSLDEFNRPTESCRHASDPELRFKPNLRAKGTWDYHTAHREREQRINALEERLRKLEELVAAANTPAADRSDETTWTVHEQEIVNLSADGKRPGQIAETIGDGLTAQKVGLILKRTTLTPQQPAIA